MTRSDSYRSARFLGVHQACTSSNHPKGNADTERLTRTIKEELIWLREWCDPYQLLTAVGAGIEQYNERYLHSALGYQTANQTEATDTMTTGPLLEIAG